MMVSTRGRYALRMMIDLAENGRAGEYIAMKDIAGRLEISKKYMEQIRIVKEVLHSRRHSDDIRNFVKGVMIESYIVPGCQKVGEGVYGKSITDPCLGWEETIRLVQDIADLI